MRLLSILNCFLGNRKSTPKARGAATRADRRNRIAEQLEARHLLAGDLFISEVLYDPNTFSGFNDRYFEVRGTPDATIPADTYFLVVDTDGIGTRAGELNARFDLGGLTLGSNGHLVIAQGGNNYTFDPDGTSMSGTDGFNGLPGGIYDSDTIGGADRFEQTFSSNAFMLVEAPNVPGINTDFDVNDDGVLDGDAASWTVLDAFTVNGHNQGGTVDDKVYGGILFRTEGNTSTPPQGVEAVDVAFAGYIARVGNRTGYSQDDFAVGEVSLAFDGSASEISSTAGNEVYRLYAGSRLNHLGGANFFSTIHDTKLDTNGIPVAGATVYVDVNGNGQLDNFETVIEPDDFDNGYELIKVAPGVTLTAENSDLTMDEVPPIAEDNPNDATTGVRRFDLGSHALRLDFVEPIQSISIDASNLGTTIPRTGEMTVHDANGNLLSSFSTGQMVDEFQTMTITRPSADIAMVRANFNPVYGSISRLDNIRFSRPEPSAVTDANGEYTIENVDLHIGGSTTATLATVGELGGETLVFDRAQFFGTTMMSGTLENPDSILGRTGDEWWIAESDGSQFTTKFFGDWANVPWGDVVHGDFDGDGVLDIAGRIGREWWVSVTGPNGIVNTQFWGDWPAVASWTDVQIADVNGDGLSDILGRNDGGAWWVARSTGATFAIEQWSHWSLNVTWDDPVVGDFNGDGLDDLAGRVNGTWYVDVSTGQQFDFQQWGSWSTAVSWDDVQVGDFNGDGYDDIAGRANGQWWLAQSTASSFQSTFWGQWSNTVTWDDVQVGDFNGDGLDDIAGRTSGQWWLAHSEGSFFTVPFWGRWSNSVTWDDVRVGDFNGDGMDDIAGRTSGSWWVARSANTFFFVEQWGSWSNAVTWENVHAGQFTAGSVNGLSVQLSTDELVDRPSVSIEAAQQQHLREDGQRVRRGGRFQ